MHNIPVEKYPSRSAGLFKWRAIKIDVETAYNAWIAVKIFSRGERSPIAVRASTLSVPRCPANIVSTTDVMISISSEKIAGNENVATNLRMDFDS